jgi:hypothetical protein
VRCTHLDESWLRAHGPAFCTECGYVDASGYRIDPRSGRRLDSVPPDLLYAELEDETLLFIPREIAESLRGVRKQLARCRTWGEARQALDRDWFDRLKREYGVRTTVDGDALDGNNIAAYWPSVRSNEVPDWLPEDVVREFGEAYDGLLDSGIIFPASNRRAVFRALSRKGLRSRGDARIIELFHDPA